MPVRPPESLLSAILIILINGTPPRQTTNVPTPTGECSPKKGLFRHLRWRDVIVIAAGLALGVAIKFHYAHPDHPLGGRDPSDYEKWQVRPPMPRVALGEQNTVQEDTMPPCFFLRPKGANGQSATTGAVSHCLPLLPDGQNLDVFEVHLYGVVQHVKTDVYVPGSMPHAFTRLTEPLTKWSKSYQLYVSHVYEPLLSGSRLPYAFMDWRLPDGRTIHYTRISPGSGFADPVYETQSNVAPFARSRVSWNGWGWDLALQDGTTWLSPEAYNATRPQQASLIGIFDKNGNEVRLVRKKDGRLVKIKNPDGGWIAFSYDGDGRMTESADTAGHAAKYAYDSDDQISAVHYADGSTTKYAYDSSSRLLTASNSATGLSLSAVYNTNGQIEHLYIDGET